MRYKTMLAASAAAAAASVIPVGTAAASTPDWLTIVDVETGQPTLLPMVCGEEPSGTALDPACESLLGSGWEPEAGFGAELPDVPGGYGRTLANVDMRDFAKWQVCGVQAGASSEGLDCDNSITAERAPMSSGDGYLLANVDATGAFEWSVCGISTSGKTAGSC